MNFIFILIFFYTDFRNDIDEFEIVSCTDTKCMWKQSQKKVLEQYKATELENHECYNKFYKDCSAMNLSSFQMEQIEKKIQESGSNAFTKHM